MEQLIAGDPTRIGPYRLIARLGAGGMGLVYVGRSETGRTVAVKVVQEEYAAHPEFRRRFAREVAAARRVGGEWTAAVLDADTEAPTPWVATQYIPGPDLHTVVAEDFGPLAEDSLRVLANRLALALDAIHAAGLVHRDLKPSNVLVTVDGPRVIDFGIVRALGSLTGDSLHTRTGMLIGSPGFMSPEQVRGQELTPASDVFCLGAVLVYAATGRLLFGAADTALHAHLFRIAEEEADLTGVPESLAGLVRACLDKDPARRPAPAQIAERTGGADDGVWLPGQVLAQLGRHAAQLLDYAPPPRPEPHAGLPAYTPTVADDQQSERAARPARWRGLVPLALAQLMVLFNTTNLNWPSVRQGYAPVPGQDTAAVFFYLALFCGLLLPAGRLADLVGRRRVLGTGLAGFAVASALGGVAPGGLHSGLLTGARALQGGFGALVTAAAFGSVLALSTGPQQRRTAFAVWGAAAVGGPVLGLALDLPWRTALYVSVPLALIGAAGIAALPEDEPRRAGARFDGVGALLCVCGLSLLVLGLAPSAWEPSSVVLDAAGVALLAAFGWRQAAAADPLLPPALLRDRRRLGGLVALTLAQAGLVATVIVLGQDDLLYVIPALAVGAVCGRLPARTAPGAVIVTGAVVAALGASGPVLGAAPVFCAALTGAGAGLCVPALYAVATGRVEPGGTGVAAATVFVALQVGAALGAGPLADRGFIVHRPAQGLHIMACAALLLAAATAVRTGRGEPARAAHGGPRPGGRTER
ncbi:hypothetical protein Shyhy01_26460 [Streptomyces hygroscopicus subsp. hygroscopicus]|nr:bifunctional serine/threonine protein kinase/MFS transporter [Streptomyces hygroscopicus]GLX49696.1 hypothetical protein Shyhy01_26460 [Streptomyces hygroscopicus subsp. hygroscopicus]